MEGRRSGSTSQSGPAGGIRSAWYRRRGIGPGPNDANDDWRGMLARPGLALAERLGVIEVDLPDGVRVRVDSSVKEKALRRVLSAVRGLG